MPNTPQSSKCPDCNSMRLNSFGYRRHGSTPMKKFQCIDCRIVFYEPLESPSEPLANEPTESNDVELKQEQIISHIRDNYTLSEAQVQSLESEQKIVVTSVVWGCEVNHDFLETLKIYCSANNAVLVIIPIVYQHYTQMTPLTDFANEETALKPFLVYNNFHFGNNVKVMGAFRLNAALENPLSGLDSLCKGNSLVFGHPQVALKTVATHSLDHAPILTTTGCLTEPNYSDTKQGYKASFNHKYAAVVIEKSDEDFFIRHLHFDDEKVYDIDRVYTKNGHSRYNDQCLALVTGDEHVFAIDNSVVLATYLNNNSITKTLRPKFIFRHDVLDCYSISHHHRKNLFVQFAKHHSPAGNLENELEETLSFVTYTTPKDSKTVIVSSNHNDHLLRWLNECDPKQDHENAILYHHLMYLMLENTEFVPEHGTRYPDPFQLYAEKIYKIDEEKIQFLDRNETFKIGGIELSSHGDIGKNGSRGSARQFAQFEEKYVIGHSHSPAIEKGAYQVGLSARKNLEYNQGASSWSHCHCIVYPNGSRQLLFIRNGKWKA